MFPRIHCPGSLGYCVRYSMQASKGCVRLRNAFKTALFGVILDKPNCGADYARCAVLYCLQILNPMLYFLSMSTCLRRIGPCDRMCCLFERCTEGML